MRERERDAAGGPRDNDRPPASEGKVPGETAAGSAPSGTRSCRLQKTKRLILSSEFARVKGQGSTERGRYLVLGAAKISEEKLFRVGFVTPKHIGTAVVRNRARRRMRDIVRTHQTRLRPGLWLVVVARPYAVNATYDQLRDEWLRLAERASILAP